METVDLRRAGVRPGARVLDLGSGSGRHTFGAARIGGQVVSLDTDPVALRGVRDMNAAMLAAGEIAPSSLPSVLRGDALRLPFADASLDVVIVSEVLEHLGDDLGALRECARVLRDGGLLGLSVPSALPERVNWLLSDRYHDRPGGHLRIYRLAVLVGRARRAGFGLLGTNRAHALHSPYWWLRCAVGVDRDDHPAVRAVHGLLVYELMHRSKVLATIERLGAPVLGKSLVVYLRRRAR